MIRINLQTRCKRAVVVPVHNRDDLLESYREPARIIDRLNQVYRSIHATFYRDETARRVDRGYLIFQCHRTILFLSNRLEVIPMITRRNIIRNDVTIR